MITTKNGSRYRKVLCTALIMLVLVALVGTAIYFFAFNRTSSAAALTGKRSVYLEDILNGQLHVYTNNATWLTNSELLYRNENVSYI